ncbi:MAG: ABC transporter permease, partial [Pseudomonadota bacterium]
MRAFLISCLTMLLAFAVAGIVVWGVGENPWQVYKILFSSAFGSFSALGYTLYYATPLIFTGLSVALAFHA